MGMRLCAVRRLGISAARWLVSQPLFGLCLFCVAAPSLLFASAPPRGIPIALQPGDVIPTGNEWIALPDIRASDGALNSFNVLSARDRGLLEVTGAQGAPAIEPWFRAGGQDVPFQNPAWSLIEYWIPTARQTSDGLEMSLTWCAPHGMRAAFLLMTVTNHRAQPVDASMGITASFGSLRRVTYLPVALRGERTVAAAPWIDSAEVFSYITSDTRFAWSLIHLGSQARLSSPPLSLAPRMDAEHPVTLAPGETAQAIFVLGVGIEEFSAPHNARALQMMLDRDGAGAVLAQAADWCRRHTRTTGQPDLDMLMNRNFLFTALYAWGRTIDTEQFVGVTSRSPHYYVSAAYWDRDAMLWSFPGLLDIDTGLAREALEYAWGTQLRNAGTHSRFIDGVVLEDGFELDEAAAPLIALTEYVQRTGDTTFLIVHRDDVAMLLNRIEDHYDAATGLYSTLQDAQDEYEKPPFITYDNVLVWRTFLDAASLFDRLHDASRAGEMTERAAHLRTAILAHCISSQAPGAGGTIFISATDGHQDVFADVPPGSLLKLPVLGFVAETDPVFQRTYRWLHSGNYPYSYAGLAYGLPGSYRLPFTTSWSVADHLALSEGREQAWKVLKGSRWDAGIITEGVDPRTAAAQPAGRAFATAAGYVADAICRAACKDIQPLPEAEKR